MKIANASLVLLLTAAVCTFACDEDGKSKGDECAQAEQAIQDAADEFCAAKAAECCFCSCWPETAGQHDIDAYIASGACECVELDLGDTDNGAETACEGAALEEAQACLDDPVACAQPEVQLMNIACDASAL
jgi:hypothetical protein